MGRPTNPEALAQVEAAFVGSSDLQGHAARRLPNLSCVAEAVSPVGIERHAREAADAKGTARRIGDGGHCGNVALKPRVDVL